jgi:phosphate transport system substrate-binding protein
MKKILTIIFFLALLIYNCSSKPGEHAVISIKGSDSMLQLTENLAAEYMKHNPGISIYVYGGGTAEGIKSLIKGEIDICTASRNLKPAETKSLAEYYGSIGLFHLIAKDALSVYTNKNNTVRDLTFEQLRNIFDCKITNWKELGGKDQKITTVTRNPSSGTYLYFQEHVLEGNKYCNDAVTKSTTNDVISYIEKNENAIGYGGMGFPGNINHIKINGIEPSEENAQNDTYPITRYLHFFSTQLPKGAVRNFVNWVISPEGQTIVKQSGFIPLWEVTP